MLYQKEESEDEEEQKALAENSKAKILRVNAADAAARHKH